MALSRNLVKELNGELESLRQRREALDSCIQGIETLLAHASPGPPRAAAPQSLQERPRPVLPRQRPRRGSLRRRIIALLTESGGMRGRELSLRLDAERFRVGGKASLRERVTHELSRLQRLGVLKKSSSGRYELAAAAPVPSLASEAPLEEPAFA